MRFIIILVVVLGSSVLGAGHPVDEPSYNDTRGLLLKLNGDAGNEAFCKLFREAYRRRNSIVRALDDPESSVQADALLIIDLVPLSDLQDGFAAWRKANENTNRTWQRRVITPLDPQLAGRTFSGNPAGVAKRYLFENREGSYRILARNKEARAVLIEVVFGETFTEGWNVVLREEDSGWRPTVKTNVWVS
jgi:hypothetical protein